MTPYHGTDGIKDYNKDFCMKTKLRTIGVLAKELGVSVETIRYYQRRGLIETPERSEGKYRHYSDEILVQVHYILTAKSLGMSLKDIEKIRSKIITKPDFCAFVKEIVNEKLEAIDQEIKALHSLKLSLQSFQDRCKRRKPSDCPLFEELTKLGLAVTSSTG